MTTNCITCQHQWFQIEHHRIIETEVVHSKVPGMLVVPQQYEVGTITKVWCAQCDEIKTKEHRYGEG